MGKKKRQGKQQNRAFGLAKISDESAFVDESKRKDQTEQVLQTVEEESDEPILDGEQKDPPRNIGKVLCVLMAITFIVIGVACIVLELVNWRRALSTEESVVASNGRRASTEESVVASNDELVNTYVGDGDQVDILAMLTEAGATDISISYNMMPDYFSSFSLNTDVVTLEFTKDNCHYYVYQNIDESRHFQSYICVDDGYDSFVTEPSDSGNILHDLELPFLITEKSYSDLKKLANHSYSGKPTSNPLSEIGIESYYLVEDGELKQMW